MTPAVAVRFRDQEGGLGGLRGRDGSPAGRRVRPALAHDAGVVQKLDERWFPAVRATTWAHYERYVESYLVPRIGALPPQQLTADDLERLYEGASGLGAPTAGRRPWRPPGGRLPRLCEVGDPTAGVQGAGRGPVRHRWSHRSGGVVRARRLSPVLPLGPGCAPHRLGRDRRRFRSATRWRLPVPAGPETLRSAL